MDDFCGLDWGTLVAEQEEREEEEEEEIDE